MPRRKAAEVEILPPEDDQPLRGRKKLVEAEHTIKYSAPVPVTVETDPEEENQEEDFDFVEKEKSKRRKKTAKEERDELRREMDKLGVAGVSRLKLSIDKYRHSDSDDSGTLAEKDYCTKYPVTKDHILNDEYMDIARRYGPGRYWFTLRMDNVIARQWERQVNAVITPSGPVIQQINPNDPTSPPFIIQTTNDGQQVGAVPTLKDFMKGQREALKEQLEMAKLIREAYGLQPDAAAQPARSEEEVLTSAILKQPEVIENVVGSVMKRFGGKGSADDEPWYAEVVRDAVKSGQAAGIIRTAIDSIFSGFRGLFPGGQNNGQASMAQAPIQTNESADSQRANDGRNVVAQEIPQGNQSLQPANGEANQQGGMLQSSSEQITPEQHALSRLIQNCQRNVPVQVAYQQLINYADAVNDQAPDLSIDGYIDLLGSMPTDQVIEFVKTLPGGEQIAALPHAKEWTAELQRLIKESQEGGEEG